MNQIKLPNRADVTIDLHKFVADSSHLHIGIDEFAECNNIVLQDVYYKDEIHCSIMTTMLIKVFIKHTCHGISIQVILKN